MVLSSGVIPKKDTGIDWSVSLTVVNINGGSDRHVGPASQHAVISSPLLLVLFFDGGCASTCGSDTEMFHDVALGAL